MHEGSTEIDEKGDVHIGNYRQDADHLWGVCLIPHCEWRGTEFPVDTDSSVAEQQCREEWQQHLAEVRRRRKEAEAKRHGFVYDESK